MRNVFVPKVLVCKSVQFYIKIKIPQVFRGRLLGRRSGPPDGGDFLTGGGFPIYDRWGWGDFENNSKLTLLIGHLMHKK